MRKEIIGADDLLYKVSVRIPFSMITPINEPIVRRDFLAKKVKNPILKYKEPSEKLLRFRRLISEIQLEEKDFIDSFIVEKQEDVIRKIDLINSIGCFDFTERSRKIYGIPERALVDKAYEVLNEKIKKEKETKIGSEESQKLIKQAFAQFGLKYKILRKNLVNSCLINSTKKEFVLKKNHRYSLEFINRLIVHEIGTHAFRYENGALQKLQIFKSGVANYLLTEEGLAAYNEERFGVLSQKNMRNYAGRVIAIHTAQYGTFYDTFKELRKYFEPKTAFTLTLRAKRGIANTEMPGGYTKDLAYLKGYYDVKHYAEKNNVRDLYYGKIAMKDVQFVKSLHMKEPEFVPDDFEYFSTLQDK